MQRSRIMRYILFSWLSSPLSLLWLLWPWPFTPAILVSFVMEPLSLLFHRSGMIFSYIRPWSAPSFLQVFTTTVPSSWGLPWLYLKFLYLLLTLTLSLLCNTYWYLACYIHNLFLLAYYLSHSSINSVVHECFPVLFTTIFPVPRAKPGNIKA